MKASKRKIQKQIAKVGAEKLEAMNRVLVRGGFSISPRAKGALRRSRAERDRRNTAKPTPARKPIEILRAEGWEMPWLAHGFSTRAGGASTVFSGGESGELNLGFVAHDAKTAVEKNRATFFKMLGAPKSPLVSLRQIHSGIIRVVGNKATQTLVGDGAITNVPGLLLSVQTADCVPVLVVDTKKKAIAAFHAGWRGTTKRIVEKGVGMMRMEFGSDPQDLRAAIGPCIQQCCYSVGDEVVDEFHSQFAYAPGLFKEYYEDDPIKLKYPLLFLTARAPGHSDLGPEIHLDLTKANRQQLLDAGVPDGSIWVSGMCTSCNTDRLFSHRKEGGFTGRMLAVVGMDIGKRTARKKPGQNPGYKPRQK